MQMNKKLVFKNGEISDNYASILVGHSSYEQVTVLLKHKGYELVVESCVDISLPNETILTGPEALQLVESESLTLTELVAFLRGDGSDKTDDVYEFESCAWFSWRSESGDWSSEPFDTLFESLDENINKLTEILNNEGVECPFN
tara:strand:- start:7759 stop:8190 length:432 start_codon:yes stop_codon:yes gene_type:complete